MSRNYESSGPDVKIRGTAMHIAEKYSSLARDAMSSGDTVAAENYLQHAEHYNRIILAAQSAGMLDGQPPMNGGRFGQSDAFQRDYDGDGDDGDDGDYLPQPPQLQPQPPQRQIPERVAYNQNQPQPYIPQNAFPQIQPQPIAPAANGAPGLGGDPFPAAQDGDRMPRRRRRRPIGELPMKGLNGRSGNGAPQPGEDGAPPPPATESKPDETAS
jgi:hypothetical protein